MNTLGIRKAKTHLSARVRAAAGGECTLITDNGRPVAMIAPAPKSPAHADASAEPAEARKSLSDATAFRKALLSAPYPLELDF